jgi:hypothetical protein
MKKASEYHYWEAFVLSLGAIIGLHKVVEVFEYK